ncbi:MAG: hypothetical protein ACREQY_12500, partial [Candidatus Binatia bacterium]
GGASWITVNATPNDPLQRGGIHLGGGSEIHRNLLDFFDADLDAQGRMTVGYADGCVGRCAQSPDGARGNSYYAFGTIARQSGGRRLVPEFDPPATTVPGAPRLTVTRNDPHAHLSWSQSEDGGSPITGYRLFRRAGTGDEELLATLDGEARSFVDATVEADATYAYRVSAANALGESCGTNETEAEPVGGSCAPRGVRLVTDADGDQIGAPLEPDMDIEWVSVGEPYFADGSRKLVFTLKVASLAAPLTPNRMWRIRWSYPDAPVEGNPTSAQFVGRYYIGMTTDPSGVASFEYGIAQSLTAVVIDAGPTEILGAADPESGFDPDGTIRLVISADKVGGPRPGDLIGALAARSFAVAQDTTQRGDYAADVASFADTYALVGNTACAPSVSCSEESAAEVSYSNGWHTVADADASGGSFRLNPSKSGNGSLRFTFDVPAGATGAVAYRFAKSTKGGTADAYVDGVFHSQVDYRGESGSLNDPAFGFEARFEGLEPGAHSFELRNVEGAVYVDAFCLESGASSGLATEGPGATTTVTQTLSALGNLVRSVQATAGTQSISA